LAIAKILGILTIWSNKLPILKQWAYAGFFFDLVLALTAHLYVQDGEYAPAILGLLFLLSSLFFEKKEEQGLY
jgi:hypothetical protein